MARLFKNKYRIDTIRSKYWDYAGPGVYFITICAKNHAHYFGYIHDAVMHHSEIGAIAHRCWADIPLHFPFVHLGEFVIMPNHVHGILIVDKTNDVRGMDSAQNTHVERRGVDPHTDVERRGVDPHTDVERRGVVPHTDVERRGVDPHTDVERRGVVPHTDVERRGVVPHTDVERRTVDPQDLADLQWAERHPNAPRPPLNRFGPQSRNLASIVRGFKTGVTKFARHHNPEFAWQSLYHDIIIRNDRAFNIISDYIRNNPTKWEQDRFKKRGKR